jgi:hypothetical protein
VRGLSLAAGSRLLVQLLPQVLPRKQATAGGGSLAFKVLPGGSANVTTKEVAADDPASSVGLSGGACFSTEATDHSGAVEPEVILGHLSHPKISILECEPFFERNLNFTKDFIYLNLKCFILFILYLLLSSKNQSI